MSFIKQIKNQKIFTHLFEVLNIFESLEGHVQLTSLLSFSSNDFLNLARSLMKSKAKVRHPRNFSNCFCRMICVTFISIPNFLFSTNAFVLTKDYTMINTSLGDNKDIMFILFYGIGEDRDIINVN